MDIKTAYNLWLENANDDADLIDIYGLKTLMMMQIL